MPWNDLSVADYAKKALQNCLAKQRLSGSFLLWGPEGTGKLRLAKAVAKALFCPYKNKENDFCDACPSCHQVEENNFPDFILVEPEGSYIKINQIRNLQETATLPPFQSKKRLVIINQAERMNPEAANCLLKTLEEPQEYTIIFLCTAAISSLLPTIISRCQLIRVGGIAEEEVTKYLINKYDLAYEEAMVLARISEGRPEWASQLYEANLLRLRDKALKFVTEDIRKPDFHIIQVAEEITSGRSAAKREELRLLLRCMLGIIRDAIILRQDLAPTLCINVDCTEKIEQGFNTFSPDTLISITHHLVEAENRLRQNANLQSVIEELLMIIKDAPREI